MKSYTLRIILALALISSSACVFQPRLQVATPDPLLLSEIPGDPSQIPDPVAVLALSDDIRALIDQHIDHNWSSKRKLDALREMIFAEDMLNLRYDTSRTRTAIETFNARQGNCLSMTNLFIAMARYADLDARYHLVPTLPWWDASANTMIWNEHINATGELGYDANYVLDFVPEPAAALRNKDKTVSDDYAKALYYNNLGAEDLVAGNNNLSALNNLRVALAIQPDLANAWNNMAIVQRRLEREDLMETALLQALSLDPGHQTAMSNLAALYERQGSTEAAAYYRDRVSRYRESNPFYLYSEGATAIKTGDYRSAIKLLRKAIRIANDLPEFYLALARAYELDGNLRSSEQYRLKSHYLEQIPNRDQGRGTRGTTRLISDPGAERFMRQPSMTILFD